MGGGGLEGHEEGERQRRREEIEIGGKEAG